MAYPYPYYDPYEYQAPVYQPTTIAKTGGAGTSTQPKSASFLPYVEAAAVALDTLSKLFGGDTKRAGLFSKNEIVNWLSYLREMFQGKPGTEGALAMFGIGPEATRRKMAEVTQGIQPEFARQRALVGRGLGGNQPGILADLGTAQGANLLDLYRKITISEDERRGQVLQNMMNTISQIYLS